MVCRIVNLYKVMGEGIIKTTITLLIKQCNVKIENKSVLKKDLLFFDSVDYIEPSASKWDRIRYQRNNQSYRMLLNICRLVIDGLLLSTEQGMIKMATFLDDQRMSHLYEKFIIEYFRYHHPELRANPDQVQWNLDDDNDTWLPNMISDVFERYYEMFNDDTWILLFENIVTRFAESDYGTIASLWGDFTIFSIHYLSRRDKDKIKALFDCLCKTHESLSSANGRVKIKEEKLILDENIMSLSDMVNFQLNI